jgi:hypothetical protein
MLLAEKQLQKFGKAMNLRELSECLKTKGLGLNSGVRASRVAVSGYWELATNAHAF